MSESNGTDLISRFSIEALVASRDAVVESFRESARRISEAVNTGEEWSLHLPSLRTDQGVYLLDNKEGDLDSRIVLNIDQAYWRALMQRSGIRDIMSASAMKDLDSTVSSEKCPELTAAHIRATFHGLSARREGMFSDFLISIYKHICWDRKTNQPAQFGERMILHRCQSYWSKDRPTIEYNSVVVELERALATLAGNPVPTFDTSVQRAVKGVAFGEWFSAPGENPTFSIKLFKNGNGHLRVKRNLIDEMNRIVAASYQNALPWAKGSKAS